MGNPEKLATLGTQDTRRRQTTQKTKTMSISDLKTNRGEPRHPWRSSRSCLVQDTHIVNMCWTPLYANKHK